MKLVLTYAYLSVEVVQRNYSDFHLSVLIFFVGELSTVINDIGKTIVLIFSNGVISSPSCLPTTETKKYAPEAIQTAPIKSIGALYLNSSMSPRVKVKLSISVKLISLCIVSAL
ncbi:hypothetical protein [Brumimicrobium oceani]|uniref:Uncharacterized protein n=1 Tax=Brumimicrobium oceani TaxID=2100725 RepID=A0A2U2XF81_9FLAO|nr:hypothetical protein [Brumimicrobium oceani]PWH86458.1 hypothetical protein DIT68_04265 [Brumimicrobium oceani]